MYIDGVGDFLKASSTLKPKCLLENMNKHDQQRPQIDMLPGANQ